MESLADILIVDDLPSNLEAVSTILAPLGYSIATVSSAERALEQLKRFQPDLILLDSQMPGMDGFEVCERIKANPETTHIPIIFLTMQSDANSITRAFDLGAVDYITKPFQETELVARVKTHLKLQCVNQFLEQQVAERTQQLAVKTEELKIALAESKASQQQLDSLIAGTAATTGDDFFPALASHIAKALNVSCTFVTQRLNNQLQTLAIWFNGKLLKGLTYDYVQTPCEIMLRSGEFYCQSNVQQQFPKDSLLVDLGMDSYLGISLKNEDGKTIGGLSILNQGPLPNPERAKQVLSVFAARAAAELERQQANIALEELNQSLETQVADRTAALQNNEERLRLAMKAAKQAFFEINLQTDEAIVSPEYALMLGYDPANFHENVTTWRSRLHPEDSEHTHQAYRDYAAGQTSRYEAEFRLRTQQGNWKWTLSTGQFSEWDKAGHPTHLLGIHTDIHERKLAEIQLRAQSELLELIACREPLSQVLSVLVERMEQCIEGAICLLMLRDNDNCLQFGAGVSLPAAYAEAANCVQIVEQLSLCTRAAYTKQTVIVEDFANSPLLSPDYKALAAQHGFQAGWSVPITANDRSLLGTFTIHYQTIQLPQAKELNIITQMAHIAGIAIERQRADEQLRRSEANLLEAQQVAHVGNWGFDVATQTVTWSPEMFRNYGLEPADTAPSVEAYLDMLQEGDRQHLQALLERALTQGIPYSLEYSMVHSDGTISYHECRAEVEQDSHGNVTRLFGTNLNITERKQAEQALQNLIEGTAATTGQDFFPALVRHIAEALNVTYAVVTERIDDTLHTLAFWGQGALMPNYIYPIADTPCERVFQTGEFFCDTEIQQHFPHDRDLIDLEVESYLGIALRNNQGQAIGHLYVMDSRPIATIQRAQQILRVFAARAAAELERQRAQTELENLNAALESKVVERTAELEASNTRLADSNQELESFAYSVSHDLRAPLRAIDGFSKALLEDYGSSFDSIASGYFDRIRKNIARMSMLIDDLLSLSRVSQAELHSVNVNLTSLAHEIVHELQESDPERPVEIIIAPSMTTIADTTLMRMMLTNLLQNAWKFTSHHPSARIEFGQHEQAKDGQPTYFVKDDGAGFNMDYVDKLFGVFQRLHTEKEFPGTGIGLATVQRIIHRHGGRVWADAGVEQGATFYFTLPQQTQFD